MDIQHTESLIDDSRTSTTNHGEKVLGLCCQTAPDATYSLYQAADGSGDIISMDYARAIELAIAHGVDILNISYGEFMPGCQGGCPFCLAAKKAIDEGVVVVVAAGNVESEKPSIFCPGLVDDVICVGGMVVECSNGGSETPTGAYQLPNPRSRYEQIDCTYCGRRGCDDGDSGVCINDVERPWKGNPSSVGDKPDLLAPAHMITAGNDGKITSTAGTSYAAPLVSAALAVVASELPAGESLPNPYQTRQLLLSTRTPIKDAPAGKMNFLALLSASEDQSRATGNTD